MSTPKFQNTGTTYIFEWATECLKAEVSRVRAHRDGKVTCRILWTTSKSGYAHHIWQKDGFNLSAGNNAINRNELASRYKEKVDWTEILEQVTVNSIAEFERGEPMITILGSDQIVKPRYIIHPFLVEHFPSVLFGDPSSGKTTFSLFLALIATIQWMDNPIGLTAPAEKHKVGYFDWETGKEGIEWQWKCVQAGAGIKDTPLYYRRCHAPLADDLDAIKEYVTDNNLTIMILDSLGLAAGGELKDTSSPLAFYRALGQLNITSLSLAHTPKEKENRTIYGNRFFEAETRNSWEIIKEQEQGSNEMLIGLRHSKPLPWDKMMPDMAFTMTFSENGHGTSFSTGDPNTVEKLVERQTTEKAIMDLLKAERKPMTPTEMATALGKSPANIRVVLGRVMKRKNPPFAVKGEHYSLVAKVEDFILPPDNHEEITF